MSEEGKNDSEKDDENVNIYDDNAYLFGDDLSENNSENKKEIKGINNEDNVNYTKEIENEGLIDVNNKEIYINNNQRELEINNSKNNNKEILAILNQEENINKNENFIQKSKEDNENLNDKILIRNQIGQNNENIDNYNKNESKENEFKKTDNINQNEEYEIGQEGAEEEENGELGEGNEEIEDVEEEGKINLVTLKLISICQYCRNDFNSTIHLPYLLKCGHFFCLECINNNFTDKDGIKCPNDGLVALSIKELKLLNNLIIDKNIPTQRDKKDNEIENDNKKGKNNSLKFNENNSCKIHKGQKLTHIISETKQLVCIYCALDLIRKNPNCEVIEIKEKADYLISEVENIINLNQNNIKIIQDSLKDIKINKESEEKNINLYFENIFKYLNNKKSEYLSLINSLFTDNEKKLNQKLEILTKQIQDGETIKELIGNLEQNNNFDEILETYLNLHSIKNNKQDNQINLYEYKFIHDEESKILKYINNSGDIKINNKYLSFQNEKKNNFNLKFFSTSTSDNAEPKKNYLNYNSPMTYMDNSKNSSIFNNISNNNNEKLNEINCKNIISNNKKRNYSNYNFNFSKINPISNNIIKGKLTPKPIILNNNNLYRNSFNGYNDNNINHINLGADNRDKTYFLNSSNSLNNKKILRGNRINNSGGIYTISNFYYLNNAKKLGDKENTNYNSLYQSRNRKNNYDILSQHSLGNDYIGFKTYNLNS